MKRFVIRPLTILLVCILAVSAFSGCTKLSGSKDAKEETEESDDQKTSKTKKKKPSSKKKDDADKKEETEESGDPYAADASDVFASMSDWAFTFSSGAGGWATEMTVENDGSFSGRYYDSEMGLTGPGYDNGTMYECEFTGHFSSMVETAGPLMYKLTIEDLTYAHEPDTEEIKDNTNYIYAGAYGIDGLEGKEGALVFMDAGAVTSAINQDQLDWLSTTHFGNGVGEDWEYVQDIPEELPFAALINTKDDYAFFSYNRSGNNRTYLVNKVQLPGLRNTEAELNKDGTYYFEDVNADGTFKVINVCFKTQKAYNVYLEPEPLVNDCIKQIYGKEFGGDELYIFSPKDAYSMIYDKVAVCGEESDYAFWYPDGRKDGHSCEGRFVFRDGIDSGAAFVYAYIIETYPSTDTFPNSSISSFYLGSLKLTGLSDHLSSASDGENAVKRITCEMKAPKGDTVSLMEAVMVGMNDTDLIKKYHLENAEFYDDYELVYPDNEYRDYKLALGADTPLYVQFPEDQFHKLCFGYNFGEYMNQYGNNDPDATRLMQLFLDENDGIVYGFEQYVP